MNWGLSMINDYIIIIQKTNEFIQYVKSNEISNDNDIFECYRNILNHQLMLSWGGYE